MSGISMYLLNYLANQYELFLYQPVDEILVCEPNRDTHLSDESTSDIICEGETCVNKPNISR